MVGRVAGEQTYYYNVSTGETRYDKPEEFMLEDELREHHNFLKFQLAAETHAKKVGELQVRSRRPNALEITKETTHDLVRRSQIHGAPAVRPARVLRRLRERYAVSLHPEYGFRPEQGHPRISAQPEHGGQVDLHRAGPGPGRHRRETH